MSSGFCFVVAGITIEHVCQIGDGAFTLFHHLIINGGDHFMFIKVGERYQRIHGCFVTEAIS